MQQCLIDKGVFVCWPIAALGKGKFTSLEFDEVNNNIFYQVVM